jgi:hypothetical protein
MGDVRIKFYDNAVNKVNGVYYLRRYVLQIMYLLAPPKAQF